MSAASSKRSAARRRRRTAEASAAEPRRVGRAAAKPTGAHVTPGGSRCRSTHPTALFGAIAAWPAASAARTGPACKSDRTGDRGPAPRSRSRPVGARNRCRSRSAHGIAGGGSGASNSRTSAAVPPARHRRSFSASTWRVSSVPGQHRRTNGPPSLGATPRCGGPSEAARVEAEARTAAGAFTGDRGDSPSKSMRPRPVEATTGAGESAEIAARKTRGCAAGGLRPTRRTADVGKGGGPARRRGRADLFRRRRPRRHGAPAYRGQVGQGPPLVGMPAAGTGPDSVAVGAPQHGE